MKKSRLSGSFALPRRLSGSFALPLASLAATVVALLGAPVAFAEERPFDGLRALVVEPENSWGWDSAIFGALEERGFEVDFGGVPKEPASLARYDLVALSIRRGLTASEADALKNYVSQGGAVYGSWGGPFGAWGFQREVCRVGGIKSVRISEVRLLPSPMTKGIADDRLIFPDHVGHTAAKAWEVVSLDPLPGAIPVAKDPAGHCVGVLSPFGKGRAVVLGFGPEREKQFTKPALGPALLDNLLAWLLEGKLAGERKAGPPRLSIALPRRAEIREVTVNGKRVANPQVKEIGSLKRVALDAESLGAGELDVRIAYKPLAPERNAETVIHLPWNTLRAAADSPARLAEHLKSLNATVVQPLLRGPFGEAWYKGMPEDKPDEKLVKAYRGDFLADLIGECHKRGIKVIAGVYFDSATPIAKHPEAKRLDRQGKEVKDQYGRTLACFNNPQGQEHNLATIEDLLARFRVDGIILDDNFELDKNDCYCPFCKEGFTRYCEAKGLAWRDPAQGGGEALAAWREYQRGATRSLAASVSKIARGHGVRAGGWVGVGMDAAHLAEPFDFLGGMVYAEPPRAARGPLSVLGGRGFICLLWAPGTSAETIEREAREAVHAGCPAVGYWVRGDDGGYAMDEARSAAIRRAFARVERDWREFYRASILSGDPRFVLADGKVGRDEARLRIRNLGEQRGPRLQGTLTLDAALSPEGGPDR